MRLSERIYAERKKLGMSADELAKACEVSRSYITLIENGRRLPGAKLLPRIAGAFSIRPSLILDWYLEDLRDRMQRDLKIEA
jgi:transcriptional regulator with XRE-family HTH domain